MREYTLTVFDENIVGTGPWFSSSQYNDALGLADTFVGQTIVESVSNTSATLTIDMQHSCNGLDWLSLTGFSGPIGGNDATNLLTYGGDYTFGSPLSLMRFKISLSSAAASCRLKIFVCGRTARAP